MPAATAVSRLMKEFKALQSHPIPRASAHPVGDNLLKWKMIVVGEAPYDFPIRIHLDYSEDYPISAPKAYFETNMPFIGGASMIADNRLQSVCLNIFGNFAFVHTEWKNQQSGWTPAYTIETIITSIQGLMMEDMLSKDPKEIARAKKLALSFECQETGHVGSDQEQWWPPVSLEQVAPPKKTETSTVETDETDSTVAALENHYTCYVLKSCPSDRKIGFGVGVVGAKTKSFISPCEMMSKEAFDGLKVRHSSTNKQISVWVPLLNPWRNQWNGEVEAEFYQAMEAAWKETKQGAFNPIAHPIQICFSVMNNLVVEVMNSANNLTANDKFIEGYFSFLTLLRHHVDKHPEEALKYVDGPLKRFIDKADARTKVCTPNLGEFILFPLLSKTYNWNDIAEAFVNECHARCVFWYVQGSYQQKGKHPELKKKGAPHRAGKVYDATQTSRNLVCYQVAFSSIARAFLDQQEEERSPTSKFLVADDLKQEIKGLHKQILQMRTWQSYYSFVKVPFPGSVAGRSVDDLSPEEVAASMDAVLWSAVEASLKSGYHK